MRYNYIPKNKLAGLLRVVRSSNLTPAIPLQDAVALVKASGLFDEEYYYAFYPDVQNAGVDPLVHYLQTGWKEGRNPNLWFNTTFYQEENPDIASGVTPFLHFIMQGYAEGRRPNPHTIQRRGRLIVSLSPGDNSWETIKSCLASLLKQTKRADRIILHLPRQKFLGKQFVFYFLEMIDQGVEIRWCDDFGPYTALIQCLMDYPDDIIATCSTDYVYAPDFLASLYASYREAPENLHCIRAVKASQEDGHIEYSLGNDDFHASASFMNVPHIKFGLLIPPRAFDEIAVDRDIFYRYAPENPDLWCWVMSLINLKKIKVVSGNMAKINNWNINLAIFNRQLIDRREIFINESHALLYYFKDKINKIHNIDFYKDIIKSKVENLYLSQTGKAIDWKNICTYNEKIQYLKLYEDLSLKHILADKYAVRSYISNHIGDNHLVKLLGVWNSVEDVNFETLPNQFVLKPNHTSGTVYIVKDKSKIKYDYLKKLFEEWLEINYAHKWCELCYMTIPPLIIAEEFLGENIQDYKLLCMHGEPKLFWVDTDRFGNHKRDFYSLNWERQDIEMDYPSSGLAIQCPKNLDDMIKIARILSKPFIHSRIDFYQCDQLKVGEITFYTNAGYRKFTPPSVNFWLGDMINLENK